MTFAPTTPDIPPGPAAARTMAWDADPGPGPSRDAQLPPVAAPSPAVPAPTPPAPAQRPAGRPSPLLRNGDNAQRLATWLYVIAATASWIGQIWAGVDNIPWAYFIPVWLQILIVALPAAVLDLGGVATMAIADWRLSKGEKAIFWRILSFVWVGLAIGINVLGHLQQVLLSAVFGVFGLLAFLMALGHTEARRRDALQALGLLPPPKPRYDDEIRKNEPVAVRMAERLVVEDGYGKWQALDAAREQVMATQHRDALAAYLRNEMTRMHAGDGALAGIVVGATRFDLLADQVMAQFDLSGWAAYIGAQMRPPTDGIDTVPDLTDADVSVDVEGLMQQVPAGVIRRVPDDPEAYEAWRWLWATLQHTSEPSAEFANRHGISGRQVQWIRKVGSLGLLDSPIPPLARLLAQTRQTSDVDWAAMAAQPAPRYLRPAARPRPVVSADATAGSAR